jgi:nitroreductase
MGSIIDTIQSRTSWRTYSREKLSTEDRAKITTYIKQDQKTPFGSKPRFTLIDYAANEQLGTYGFIKDAQHFIAGATKTAPMNNEDYGYALEKIILYATDLGLGTCWLGGTFNRQGFTKETALDPDEELPAVTPIGYKAARRLLDQLIHRTAGSANRKPWSQLFYNKQFTPLSPDEAGIYATAFEMVRLAPSASNGQPWILILDEDTVHFYQNCKTDYSKYKQLDMGIAFSHLELTLNHQNIHGEWIREDPGYTSGKTGYVASWTRIKPSNS